MTLTKEERYARSKAYKSTPEFKVYRILYDKIRQSKPEYKERAKLLRNLPERKERARIASKKYRSTKAFKEWRKKYRATNRYQEYRREKDYKNKFGISINEYKMINENQKGLCAICGKKESFICKGRLYNLAVDHNHQTGKIRGLLCHDCNQALGLFKDNVSSLKKSIQYLEKRF